MATWCVIGAAAPASAHTGSTTRSLMATKPLHAVDDPTRGDRGSGRPGCRAGAVMRQQLVRFGRYLVVLLVASCTALPAPAADVPRAAQQYRSELVRNARVVWGMDAPVSTFAAQIHQESAWRPGRSLPWAHKAWPSSCRQPPAGLLGFTHAGAERPFNPSWALRALVTYDRYLYDRIRARDDCERMAMTLSAYNGGLGWISRDQKRASGSGLDPLIWWGSVETVNAGRSAANWRENRAYPDRIIHHHQPTYVAASWGQAYARESEHRGLGDRSRRARRRPGLLARRGQWPRAWRSRNTGHPRRPPGRLACRGAGRVARRRREQHGDEQGTAHSNGRPGAAEQDLEYGAQKCDCEISPGWRCSVPFRC